MNLFFDRCFGKRLPEALRLLNPPAEIIGYYDRYQDPAVGPGIPDDAWLADAGREGWTVVTMDNKWHLEDIHIASILAHQVGAFVLSGAQDATWSRAKLILADLDRLIDLSRSTPRPFLYRIDKTGKITERLMDSLGQGAASADAVAQTSWYQYRTPETGLRNSRLAASGRQERGELRRYRRVPLTVPQLWPASAL